MRKFKPTDDRARLRQQHIGIKLKTNCARKRYACWTKCDPRELRNTLQQ